MCRALTFLGVVTTLIAASGCSGPGPETGLVQIEVPGGSRVFFKRMVTGITGSRDQTVLSMDRDRCHGPNPDKDYVFVGSHLDQVFYSTSANRIDLYVASEVTTPRQANWTVRVTMHPLTVHERLDLEKTFRDRGISVADIPVQSNQCR